MEYITAKEAADKWAISQRRVAILCAEERIEGAAMLGNMWIIPHNSTKPIDGRSLRYGNNEVKLRPFVKWAGGKGQLLDVLRLSYPVELGSAINKYAEPFVGGGAVLFDILSKYDLKEIYISDINAELINTYLVIQKNVNQLIDLLGKYQDEYIVLDTEERHSYYLDKRHEFNNLVLNGKTSVSIVKASLFIFLNKTCFNGLYRVNKKGKFNVPMGAYKNPCICDKDNLINISHALKNVTISCGTFDESEYFIDQHTFVYIDPPYRPLNNTSSFTAYDENGFNDATQVELNVFSKNISDKGATLLLSNSDPKNTCPSDDFFDDLYKDFSIKRIMAKRNINSNGSKRGSVSELLISNIKCNGEIL